MAEEFIKPQDDGYLRGGVSAPQTEAIGPQVIEITGQKRSSTKSLPVVEPNKTAPWKRNNPLSLLSSYNYNCTLYMVTPECMNEFSNSNQLPATGWYIVAQSGGINSMQEPRAITNSGNLGPGQRGLDFFLEDIEIMLYLLSKDGSQTATVGSSVNFKIVEPIGFTLMTKLSRTSAAINSLSGLTTDPKPNLYQQHYLLGVRFYGYDKDGVPVQSSQFPDSRSTLNDSYAIYERIFPLVMAKVNFKIDGRATIYNFEATPMPLQGAFGSKRGLLETPLNIEGSTVGNALGSLNDDNKNSLIAKLNAAIKDKYDKKEIEKKVTFDIDWGDDLEIKNSPLRTDNEYSQTVSGMSRANTVKEVNTSISVESNATKPNIKSINFKSGTAIVNAIDNVITRSSYIVDKLLKENDDKVQTLTKNNATAILNWFSIHPVIKIDGRDDKLNDWAYSIKYQIRKWSVAYIRDQYVTGKSKYYGPVKEYNYILTGLNTEVISFEMEYNNIFYTVQPQTTNKDDSAKNNKSKETPQKIGNEINSNTTSGNLNSKDDIANNVRANLYSVADQALSTIKILGDPDFLMDSIGSQYQESTISKFYGSSGSINPYGGQIFIEIKFNVAEDYTDANGNGLLDLDPTQPVAFYPRDVTSVLGENTGLIYKVISAKSTLSRGKFEQVLELFYVPKTQLIVEGSTTGPENQRESSTSNSNAPSAGPDVDEAQQNTGANSRANNLRSIREAENRISNTADVRTPDVSTTTPNANTPEQTGEPAQQTGKLNPLLQSPVTKNTPSGVTPDDDAARAPQYADAFQQATYSQQNTDPGGREEPTQTPRGFNLQIDREPGILRPGDLPEG